MKNKILIGLLLIVLMISSFIIFGLYLMDKEDRRGEFYDLYEQIENNDNYFIILNKKEAFLIQLLGDDIFVRQGNCYMRIEDFRKKKIEVYKFDTQETYSDFTLNEAKKLIQGNTTKLIFKN